MLDENHMSAICQAYVSRWWLTSADISQMSACGVSAVIITITIFLNLLWSQPWTNDWCCCITSCVALLQDQLHAWPFCRASFMALLSGRCMALPHGQSCTAQVLIMQCQCHKHALTIGSCICNDQSLQKCYNHSLHECYNYALQNCYTSCTAEELQSIVPLNQWIVSMFFFHNRLTL